MTPTTCVTFRDADSPWSHTPRLGVVATATRHARGWHVQLADGSTAYTVTFDAVADCVLASTGVKRLTITWPDSNEPGTE